jgi:hypothetical protein
MSSNRQERPSTRLAVFIVLTLLVLYGANIRRLLTALEDRLRAGGQIKIGALELEAVHVPQSGPIDKDKRVTASQDDGSRESEREAYYKAARGVMLVHQLYKSREKGQLYDALIYLIPHKTATLAGVVRVEYFFGGFWNNQVFTSDDRAKGFPVAVSAYGPVLCTARVVFNDGSAVTLYRYIDFEMGAYAPIPAPSSAQEGFD